MPNKNQLIAKTMIIITNVFVVIMSLVDFYLKFGYDFSMKIVFYYIGVIWVRAIILLLPAIFMFQSYNIYIRYRLINEYFRWDLYMELEVSVTQSSLLLQCFLSHIKFERIDKFGWIDCSWCNEWSCLWLHRFEYSTTAPEIDGHCRTSEFLLFHAGFYRNFQTVSF